LVSPIREKGAYMNNYEIDLSKSVRQTNDNDLKTALANNGHSLIINLPEHIYNQVDIVSIFKQGKYEYCGVKPGCEEFLTYAESNKFTEQK
jgi:hypothetical protein